MYYMGIDGGGSNLRVAIIDSTTHVISRSQYSTANPGVIGHEVAKERIQTAITETIKQANVPGLTSIALGIAGASTEHSEAWLREVVRGVLPTVPVVPSSDLEIALVGAHGRREGILLLAGTGSAAYGVSTDGRPVQIGGWGYIMGDEGSGYWIGLRALRAITRAADGRSAPSVLTQQILAALSLNGSRDLIHWLYGSDEQKNVAIARLAPTVMRAASAGDHVALQIIERAADELILLCQTAIERLKLPSPKVAFAGGLLQEDNILSRKIIHWLKLPEIPRPKYEPVIGAAILARETYHQSAEKTRKSSNE